MNNTSTGRSIDVSTALHRGHPAEAQPLDSDAEVAKRVDTLIAHVQRQQAAPAGIDGEAEPRCARLLGVEAHARRGRALQIATRRSEQFEELVRGDHEVDRAIGRRQAILDDRHGPPGQPSRLGDPSGDLVHEPVAALGDEDVDRSHALLAPRDQPQRLARRSTELAQCPNQHTGLVGMVDALAEHRTHDAAPADDGRKVGDELANFVASLQRLRPQFVDLGTNGLDPATELGVLGTELFELLGRHRGKDTPEMCTRDRSPGQRP